MKKVLIAICWMGLGLFDSAQVIAETQVGLADSARLAAAEGIVLLKNDHRTLPLSPARTVSIFGRIQVDYFACGYGSGGDVKTPYIINIIDAIRRHPGIKINASLADIYESWCAENPPDNGSWGNWPLHHPEMPLDNELVRDAAKTSDAAIVVIGRAAGEDRETRLEKGSYYLTDEEEDMLERVDAHFEHVVVLLNAGNIIDMSWVARYEHIDSVLYVWQGGMQGGVAVTDVLSGDSAPSGKLTATIARRYEDYPTSGESGGEKIFGGWEFSNYVEDIFVGYRYFETFAEDRVLYPFGYGLSYTDFEIETTRLEVSDGMIDVIVSVKNTGDMYSGKEVVQVYYGAPQGRLGKAVKSLAAYAKTKSLAPGESEMLQLSFRVDDMASYDDAGKTGHKAAFVMEAGAYPVYVGNSVRSAVKIGVHVEDRLRVTKQLKEVAAVPKTSRFNRLRASSGRDGTITPSFEEVPTRTVSVEAEISSSLPAAIALTRDRGIKLYDVCSGKADMNRFVAQLSVDELEALCRGDYVMGSRLGAPGNASVYGGVMPSLREKGVVPVSAVDGPSGVRLTASASLVPIGTALACTWNDRLVEEVYSLVGREMITNQADVILAPGMNIQRDPLCGRNFEYYSEDPLLTGQMGVNVVRGLQSQGVSATPKHFGLNNQETRRNFHDSRCSERAIREIYARAFEIVVKTAKPHNIMASYNRINGVYSHYNYDLFTAMLRKEWGYQGVVMTDWWMQCDQDPHNEYIYDNAYRVQAQVDVLMPGVGPNGDHDRSLLDSYESRKGISLGEMQRCAVNVLNYVMKSPAFRKANGLEFYAYGRSEPWFNVDQAAVDIPRLAALEVGEIPLGTFHPRVLQYTVYAADMENFPVVAAHAENGCSVEIEQPTKEVPVATFRVSGLGAESLYRVYFSDAAGLPPVVNDPIYAKVTNLYVNGRKIREFYPGVYEYHTEVRSLKNAKITADVPDGITYTVTKDKESGDAVVRAESPHQAREYRIVLAQGDGKARRQNKTTLIEQNGESRVQAEDYLLVTPPIQTQECEDKGGGLNIGWTAAGTYLIYDIHIQKSGEYAVSSRVASSVSELSQLSYHIEVDGEVIASFVHGGTGGWQRWETMEAKPVYLEQGQHKLRVFFNSADVNMNYLMFKPLRGRTDSIAISKTN